MVFLCVSFFFLAPLHRQLDIVAGPKYPLQWGKEKSCMHSDEPEIEEFSDRRCSHIKIEKQL